MRAYNLFSYRAKDFCYIGALYWIYVRIYILVESYSTIFIIKN